MFAAAAGNCGEHVAQTSVSILYLFFGCCPFFPFHPPQKRIQHLDHNDACSFLQGLSGVPGQPGEPGKEGKKVSKQHQLACGVASVLVVKAVRCLALVAGRPNS